MVRNNNPTEEFTKEFIKFCKRRFKQKEFSVSYAASEFFKYRYKTKDDWNDPKKITGYVKKQSELGELFEFVESRPSERTGKISKHYRIK